MFEQIKKSGARAGGLARAMAQRPSIFPANDGRPTLHIRRQNLDADGRYASLPRLRSWAGHLLFDPDLGDVTLKGDVRAEGLVIASGGTSLTFDGACEAESILLAGSLFVQGTARLRGGLKVKGDAALGRLESGVVDVEGRLRLQSGGRVLGPMRIGGAARIGGELHVDGDLTLAADLRGIVSMGGAQRASCVVVGQLETGGSLEVERLEVGGSISCGGAIMVMGALSAGTDILAQKAVRAAWIDCARIWAGLRVGARGLEREIRTGGLNGEVRSGVLMRSDSTRAPEEGGARAAA